MLCYFVAYMQLVDIIMNLEQLLLPYNGEKRGGVATQTLVDDREWGQNPT